METNLTVTGREGLSIRLAALEACCDGLARGSLEAAASARRLGRSLAGLAATYKLVDVAQAAHNLADASDENTLAAVNALLALGRQSVDGASTASLQVLVVEDDDDIARLTVSALVAPSREVLRARSYAEAQQYLETRAFGLILLDLGLPDGDGRNILEAFRRLPATAAIPIIILSSDTAAHSREECLALGADEFLEKPVDVDVLRQVVSARLRRGAEIARAAWRDPLTGLANRDAFRGGYLRVANPAATAWSPASVVLLDFDHFKTVNDLHGHGAGDEVLRRCAGIFSSSLRSSDIIGRWGGEEFAICLPETPAADAVRLIEGLLAVIRNEAFTSPATGKVFHVTLSAGLVELRRPVSLDHAIAMGDSALYQAKASGRARVVVRQWMEPSDSPG